VRVSLHQQDRPILDALVWAVDEVEHRLVHDATTPPDVPGPDELLSWQDHNARRDDPAPSFPFWDNAETRSTWYDEQPEGPLEPTARWWWRFRPVPRFDDPWVDACRLLIPIDTMGWPAATLAHAYRAPLDVIAPTVDLSVRFHRPAPAGEEWLLCEAESPLGAEGLVTATGRVWSAGGDLLASGGQTMLCRPGVPG
jgi:acyl-CoA thioesterase